VKYIPLKTVLKNLFIFILALSLGLSSAGWTKPVKSTPTPSTQEAYFSPNGHIKSRIIEETTNAKESIDIAVFNITSLSIKTALKKVQKKGIPIRILTDRGESDDFHSVIASLLEDGFKIKLVKGKGKNGLMHNKFAIFDRKLLFTGSYNWTETAEHYSYENALFLRDKDLIKEYQAEFDSIWSKN
jgi:phosphatidylserine/phosphatidylglycerophosphate/cardiolipin synthase-like enzyme